MALPFSVTPTGISLRLRVKPKAKRNRIEGLAEDADGSSALRIAVTAAPEAGRANTAVIALLAKEWGLAKSTFRLTHGVANRRKTVAIDGDGAALKAMLDGWFAAKGITSDER